MTRQERPDTNSDYLSFIDEWRQQLITRRKFLLQSAALASTGLFPAAAFSAASNNNQTQKKWDKHALLTLSEVQNHLFPADNDSPGAKDINALPYLMNVLKQPTTEKSEKVFMRDGINWLDDLSVTTFNKKFIELNTDDREQLLKKIASSTAGENWLSSQLLYIFEALLSDPVYGGNPESVGWKWLEHQPGFPRPPVDKIYGKL